MPVFIIPTERFLMHPNFIVSVMRPNPVLVRTSRDLIWRGDDVMRHTIICRNSERGAMRRRAAEAPIRRLGD